VSGSDRLTGTQRMYLRGLAHSLDPLVHVGNAGLTENVIAATSRALADHELIKVKIAADREARERMAAEIGTACNADLAGMIGRIAILYRPKDDPEKRVVVLPGPKSE
jgi:RNA-binding protein